MQGGLHPDLKIDWHEQMLRGIRERFPQGSFALLFGFGDHCDRRIQRLDASATPSFACATRGWTPSRAAARKFSTTKSATRSRA